MTRISADHAGFTCPLRRECLAVCVAPFSSFGECNEVVAAIQPLPEGDEKDRLTGEVFQRMLPMVRKTLRRFCPPVYQGSRCEAGACYPEELVGESFLALRKAVDAYDPERRVDFVGFFGNRLFWGLEHRARDLRRTRREVGLDEGAGEAACTESDENALLTRAAVTQLLARLEPADAELLSLSAEGFNSRELAERTRASEAGVRKRLQRIRERVRKPAA